MGGASFATYLGDIIAAKEVLLYTLLSAFLIGFVYLIVLRILGGPIIYISIVAIIGGMAYGGYMLFATAKGMAVTEQYQPYYLYGSYTVWGLTAFVFCCVLCNTKNIKIGVAVMKCTAQYIQHNP